MANTIKIRRSSVASAVPTTGQLALGELAVNTFDGKLFLKKDNGTASIVEIGGSSVSIDATAADILSASSGVISADDAAADKLVFWDDSATKLTYLSLGSGISITGTTISSSGGSGVTDGDKGDITVTASGATWTIDSGVVTPAKISNGGTYKVLSSNAGTPAWNSTLVLQEPYETYRTTSDAVLVSSYKSNITLSSASGQTASSFSSFIESSNTGAHTICHYDAEQGFFSTTPTLQRGYRCNDFEGTTVYGFDSQVISGGSTVPHLATRLNFRASQNAPNYFVGALGSAGGLHASARSGLTLWDENNSHKILLQPPTDANLTADYTLTLPINDGTSGQTLITDGSGVLSWSNNYAAENVTTTGTVTGALRTVAGTATVAPLNIASGTLKTSAAIGDIEYNGTNLYGTNNTTSGRGQIPVRQVFRLTANGANLGPAIADFYGANSSISLLADTSYDVEFYAYLLKNTAGTLVWTMTASSAPNVISGTYTGSPVTGIAAGAQISGYTGSRASATAAFGATASVTAAVFMTFLIKAQVHTNAATNLRLRVTSSAGTVTPQIGSYYRILQISPNTGNFVA